MGSQIVLWLDTADKTAASQGFDEVEALFAANEQALSRFRPTSELSRLNRSSGEWVVVSELMWREVTTAVQMAATTDGRFDPTLLNALQRAGYSQSFSVGSNDFSRATAEAVTTNYRSGILQGQWRTIAFDKARRALRVPAGIQLDLGGIAKGDTAQQAVTLLQAIGPCLVDAGGDLVAGTAPFGCPGWPVSISAPGPYDEDDAQDLASIWLADGAMATSGVDYRNWLQDGRLMHHLIDPLTGCPAATDGLTVTVLAKEAALAEGWATATLIAGSNRGMEALLDHDLAGLFITQDGRILVTPGMDERLQGKF